MEIGAYMRSKMSLFVFGLARLKNKIGKASMSIGGIDIGRIMIHQYSHPDSKITLFRDGTFLQSNENCGKHARFSNLTPSRGPIICLEFFSKKRTEFEA